MNAAEKRFSLRSWFCLHLCIVFEKLSTFDTLHTLATLCLRQNRLRPIKNLLQIVKNKQVEKLQICQYTTCVTRKYLDSL